MNTSNKGFTLIELVVVITILGILAAIALPRYAALQADARMAKMFGAAGAVKAAAALAHATQLTNGLAPGASVTLEGVNITMVNGYPCSADIALAAGVTNGLSPADYNVAAAVGTCTGAGGTLTIAADASHNAAPSNCVIIYNEAPALNTQYSVNVSNLTLANCT